MWHLSSCGRFMSLNEMSPLSVHVAICARVPTLLAPSNIPLWGSLCSVPSVRTCSLGHFSSHVRITSTSLDSNLQEDLGRGGQELPLYPGGRKEFRVGDSSIRLDLKVVKLSLYVKIAVLLGS